jgi:hypothetical protein
MTFLNYTRHFQSLINSRRLSCYACNYISYIRNKLESDNLYLYLVNVVRNHRVQKNRRDFSTSSLNLSSSSVGLSELKKETIITT